MPGGLAVLIGGPTWGRAVSRVPRAGSARDGWVWAREQELRGRAGSRWFQPRRAICAGCGVHVLLPEDGLARRRDAVADVGGALVAKAAGSGHRSIAARLGVPAATVRGWLRRFGAMAERIRAHFTRWAVASDPMLGPLDPAGSASADALGAIGAAAAAAVRRLGPRPPWSLASSLTGGGRLATRAALWAAPG